MKMPRRCFTLWMVLAVLAAAIGLRLSTVIDAEPPDAKPTTTAAAETPAGDATYVGAATCSLCHSQEKPKFPTDLVQLNEYTTWHDRDRHAAAYKALEGERAEQMETLLGWAKGDAKDPAHGCIACHAIDRGAAGAEETFKVSDGVSCEACHGAASKWLDPHWKTKWRDVPAADKAAQFGLRDLRDPVVKTKLCLSCHLGSPHEGKFVTHAMFAAGHPPVPSFEVETFCDAMPPHWRPLAQRSPEIQKRLHYQPVQFARTRTMAIGGLVEQREAVQMLADGAAQAKDGELPDFALYDCAACHHELQRPSSRQERGYAGRTPGRPPPRYWTTTLAKLGFAERGSKSPSLDPLFKALDSLPFGDPAQIAAAAKMLTPQLDQSIQHLERTPFDASKMTESLQGILQVGLIEPPDYDSARQIVAALSVVAQEAESGTLPERIIPSDIRNRFDEITLSLCRRLHVPPDTSLNSKILGPQPYEFEYSPNGVQADLEWLQKLLRGSHPQPR